MGTVEATRLCGVLLGFLLLPGLSSQPTTVQPSSSQGSLGNSSLTLESTSTNAGVSSSSEPASPRPLASTATPASGRNPQLLTASSKAEAPWSSTVDGPTLSLLTVTQTQPQRHTATLDTSQGVTPRSVTTSLRTSEDMAVLPSPTSETVLTVAAFGVISFIAILVVVVIVLVSVVSLRFKCRKNKEPEDARKPGSSGLSESCSTANAEKDSITLLSMKNINMNNSAGGLSAEKVL